MFPVLEHDVLPQCPSLTRLCARSRHNLTSLTLLIVLSLVVEFSRTSSHALFTDEVTAGLQVL